MAVGPYWVGDKPNAAVTLTVVRDGSPVDLSVYTSATAVLTGPDDVVVDSTGLSVTVGSEQVTVIWPAATSLFTVPGPYTLQISLHSNGGAQDHAFPVQFWVHSPEPTVDPAWADRRDVLTLTGTDVDLPTLMQAQGVIELTVGTSYAATRASDNPVLSGRDRRLLRQAVAYQAAFMASTEGVFARAAVASLSQDGISASAASVDGDTDTTTFVLAPLAKMAVRQLSWRGSRTMQVSLGRRGGSLSALQDAWLRDEAGLTIWQPLGTRPRFNGRSTEWGS